MLFVEEPKYKQIISEGYKTADLIRYISRIDPTKRFVEGKTLLFFDLTKKLLPHHMRQHILYKIRLIALRPQKFLKIKRMHLIIRLIADTVALDSAIVNPQQRTAKIIVFLRKSGYTIDR